MAEFQICFSSSLNSIYKALWVNLRSVGEGVMLLPRNTSLHYSCDNESFLLYFMENWLRFHTLCKDMSWALRL